MFLMILAILAILASRQLALLLNEKLDVMCADSKTMGPHSIPRGGEGRDVGLGGLGM